MFHNPYDILISVLHASLIFFLHFFHMFLNPYIHNPYIFSICFTISMTFSFPYCTHLCFHSYFAPFSWFGPAVPAFPAYNGPYAYMDIYGYGYGYMDMHIHMTFSFPFCTHLCFHPYFSVAFIFIYQALPPLSRFINSKSCYDMSPLQSVRRPRDVTYFL